MALAAPDDYRENGLLPNILGLGTNVIGGAITAAIERGKQASNLMAGSEANFYSSLNNAINRSVRKGERAEDRAVRAEEFKVTTGLDAAKIAQNQKQFDARLLFDQQKEKADRTDALALLELRKKEVESVIGSRANNDQLAKNADKRADAKLKLEETGDVRDQVLFGLRTINELNKADEIAEERRVREEGRARDKELFEKSKTLFTTPPEGSAPGPLQISPTAVPEQLQTFVGEALTSKDPEILGRAQAIINARPGAKAGGLTTGEDLDLKFRVLDQTQQSLDRALQSLEKHRSGLGPDGKPKVDDNGNVIRPSLKSEKQIVELIRGYQAIIAKEPKEVRAAWQAARRAGGGVAAPVTPAGPPAPLQKSAADYLPQ